MAFTKSLLGISVVQFEHKEKLTLFPPSSHSHNIDPSIERVSTGNFILKVTHVYTVIQDNKQAVKIVTVSEFSITENPPISFKPDAEICVEAAQETVEYTRKYLYDNSINTFFTTNYIMSMLSDNIIIGNVNTAIRTMT